MGRRDKYSSDDYSDSSSDDSDSSMSSEPERRKSSRRDSRSDSRRDSDKSRKRRHKKDRKRGSKKRRIYESEGSSSDESSSSEDERRSRKKSKKDKKKDKKKEKRREKKERKRKEKEKREKLKRLLADKQERGRQKELKKAEETPEERDARRRKKREEKLRSRKQTQDLLFMGYTNDNNRFGDANLTDAFVWERKWHAKGVKQSGEDLKHVVRKKQRQKQAETMKEVKLIQKNREAREEEKEESERLREYMRREMERDLSKELEKKEDEFFKEQQKIRTRDRIKFGRWQPIDLLAKNISVLVGTDDDEVGGDIDIDAQEPYAVISKLNLDELETLLKDVDTRLGIGANTDHWKNLKVVVEDEIKNFNAGKKSHLQRDTFERVQKMARRKSHSELMDLRDSVENKIANADDDRDGLVDVEYWEATLKHLRVAIAKRFLEEQYELLCTKRLDQLRRERDARQQAQDESEQDDDEAEHDGVGDDEHGDDMHDVDEKSYDPVYVTSKDVEYGRLLADCVDADVDLQLLFEARDMVLQSKMTEFEKHKRIKPEHVQRSQVILSQPTDNHWGMSAGDMYRREANKPKNENEEVFSSTVDVKNEVYWWHDKYRPRKPRFFNRVKTGYEWNKYNQTHYDHDNPPPKIVQGYKFNIFYPDIIDPTKPPTYELLPESKNSDYATLVFTAGPPYEDIAFKIVNKEWEESHKRGFKCRFERGILHLYFNFKQFRYRR